MRIVFFGDSITKAGTRPGGYVSVVEEWLRDLYPGRNIVVTASGVTGDKVPDLERRLGRDVLSRSPTHVVVYIGVNDVAQFRGASRAGGTDKEAYRQGLSDIVNRIRRSGAQPILCTPAVFGEDVDSTGSLNRLLDEYAGISRQVAEANGIALCDLRAAFTQFLRLHNKSRLHEGVLTVDGVHLNERGNHLVSLEILRVLNLTGPAQASPTTQA